MRLRMNYMNCDHIGAHTKVCVCIVSLIRLQCVQHIVGFFNTPQPGKYSIITYHRLTVVFMITYDYDE